MVDDDGLAFGSDRLPSSDGRRSIAKGVYS